MSRKIAPRRYEVEQVLGRQIPDGLWTFLNNKGYLTESSGYRDPVQWLSEQAREHLQWEKIEGPVEFLPNAYSNRRQRRVKAMPVKRDVISSLLAAIARNDPMVQAFRQEHLKTGFLTPAEVPAWIQKRKDEAKYSHAIVLSLPAGSALKWRGEWHFKPPLRILKAGRMEHYMPNEYLAYAEPGNPWRQIIPVGRDGTLRNLQQLSTRLASQFGWQEAQATMFVLTDLAPLISINNVQARWPPALRTEAGSDAIFPVACLARMTFTVDPLMTPQEVAAMYRTARARLLRRRPRSLSDQHMLLAAYLTDHIRLDRELMAEWNRQNPKWRYKRFSLFSRDARQARHALLHDLILDYSKAVVV